MDENTAEAILEGTDLLLREMIARNELRTDDLVSCLFTCTEDLDAEFPAVAARRIGLSSVPLLCMREIDVPGALPMTIRTMLHCYADEGRDPVHVYLRDAVALRRDLHDPQ